MRGIIPLFVCLRGTNSSRISLSQSSVHFIYILKENSLIIHSQFSVLAFLGKQNLQIVWKQNERYKNA